MTEEACASKCLSVGLPPNTSTGMLLQEEEIKFYCGKPLRSCILSVTADGVTQMVTTSKDKRNVTSLSMLPNAQDSYGLKFSYNYKYWLLNSKDNYNKINAYTH